MKKSYLWILLIIALLCAPTAAFGYTLDAYGLDLDAHLFVGTLENWDNFFYGRPAADPVDPAATDVMFMERQWNQSFHDMMFCGGAPADGAYCATNVHMNLSGEQLGWTMHEFFAFAFALEPIEGAIPIDGMPGFYFITDKIWFTDPEGNETVVSEFDAAFDGKIKGKVNTLKSLTKRNFTFKGNYTDGVN